MIVSTSHAPLPEQPAQPRSLTPDGPGTRGAGTDGAGADALAQRQRLWDRFRRTERRIFGQPGWRRIIRNTLVSFILQAGTRMAAALSYYALLAAGPLLVITIALGSQFLGEDIARQIVGVTMTRLLPPSAGLPTQLVEQVVQSSPPATGLALVTGLISLVGFTRALASSLNGTLNEVGGEPIHRTFLIVPLLYLAVLGLLWGSWAFEIMGRLIESSAVHSMVPQPGLLLGKVAPLVLAVIHFAIILTIVPRASLSREEIVAPAVFVTVLWMAGWRPGGLLPDAMTLLVASGAAFSAVVFGQAANAFACRDTIRLPAALGWTTNRLLLVGIGVELVLLGLLLYQEPLARLLGQAPPTLAGWLVALMAAPAVLLADAAHKGLAAHRAA